MLEEDPLDAVARSGRGTRRGSWMEIGRDGSGCSEWKGIVRRFWKAKLVACFVIGGHRYWNDIRTLLLEIVEAGLVVTQMRLLGGDWKGWIQTRLLEGDPDTICGRCCWLFQKTPSCGHDSDDVSIKQYKKTITDIVYIN